MNCKPCLPYCCFSDRVNLGKVEVSPELKRTGECYGEGLRPTQRPHSRHNHGSEPLRAPGLQAIRRAGMRVAGAVVLSGAVPTPRIALETFSSSIAAISFSFFYRIQPSKTDTDFLSFFNPPGVGFQTLSHDSHDKPGVRCPGDRGTIIKFSL